MITSVVPQVPGVTILCIKRNPDCLSVNCHLGSFPFCSFCFALFFLCNTICMYFHSAVFGLYWIVFIKNTKTKKLSCRSANTTLSDSQVPCRLSKFYPHIKTQSLLVDPSFLPHPIFTDFPPTRLSLSALDYSCLGMWDFQNSLCWGARLIRNLEVSSPHL